MNRATLAAATILAGALAGVAPAAADDEPKPVTRVFPDGAGPAPRPVSWTSRLIDQDTGAPVAGARVTVLTRWLPKDVPPLAGETMVPGLVSTCTTASDGSFRLESVSGGRGEILAEHDGRVFFRDPFDGPLTGKRHVLRRSFAVGGTVTRAKDHVAIPGARVRVLVGDERVLPSPFEAWIETTTDAQGRYRVSGLPFGNQRIRIDAPGLSYHSELIGAEWKDVLPCDVALAAPDVVEGAVVDGATGRPVAGARLSFVPRDPGDGPAATTDAEGRFSVDGRRAREPLVMSHALRIDAPGYAPASFDLDAPRAGRVALRLAPAAEIRVVCADASGRPVPHVDVVAESRWMEATGASIREGRNACDRAVSGPDGVAVLRRLPRRRHDASLTFYVRGRPALVVRRVALDAVNARPVDAGKFTIPAQRSLDGVLRSAANEPVADARVFLIPASDDVGAWRFARAAEEGHTDAQGRFHVEGLAEGAWDIGVHHPRHAMVVVKNVDPGRLDGRPVEIALPQEISLRGRVIDADGAPIPRASVLTQPGRPFMAPEPRETTTGADGRFELPGFTAETKDLDVWVRVNRPGRDDLAVKFQATPSAGPVEFEVDPR